ncbi:MAG: response regulator transcription factor, partial [Gammaproteobacteria bacterium]|nr:response regulator transcription factor [Gammaproteobacteria bacterium]
AGIRTLLETLKNVTVVGEAADGHQVLKLVRDYQPHIVLLDISMPSLNGLEAATRLKREFPDIALVMLSMHTNEEYVLQALRAGAVGYLLKDAATAELELALTSVIQGKTYLSPSISKTLINDFLTNSPKAKTSLDRLTSRQREILQLVAEGFTTRQIAGMLNVSVKTIETHRSQLMTRLEIRDIAGLVRYAIRAGLVSSET